MHFTPTKCKVLLQNWVGSNPNLLLAGEPINVVDHLNYLGSLVSPGGLAEEEVTQRIANARAAFANLQHLWCRRDISSSIKGIVYNATVRAQSCFMDPRLGHCVQKIVEGFQCLAIGVSEALLEYGGNIVSATLKCDGWRLVVEMPAR